MNTRVDHLTQTWRRWAEPWYVAYGLLGAAVGSLVPILLPLAVGRAGDAMDVGVVMAAFHLGGMAAPLWGGLADRYRVHRGLLVGGLLVTAVALASVHGHVPLPTLQTLRQLTPALCSPFLRFLMAWLLALIGSTALFSLYPVLIQEVFAISPGLSSLTYGVAGGWRLLVYPQAGHWSMRFGQVPALRAALGVRLLAFSRLLALALIPLDGQRWLVLPTLTVVVLSWPLLCVSSTAPLPTSHPSRRGG